MSFKPVSVVLAVMFAVAAVLPASAQGFNVEEVKQTARNNGGMPNIGRPYTVRVSTGWKSNAGFERDLTDSDPSLKHWCWIPVATMSQKYIKVTPGGGQVKRGQQPNTARPKSVYAASKPVSVPLPQMHDWTMPKNSMANRSNSDVHGTVSYSKTPVAQAETKVYSYGDVSGRLNAPRYTAAYSSSKDVSGRIIH